MSLQKIIIGLLLVLSVMELRAQDTLFIAAAKMDSLKKLVLSHEGEEKVKLLNQYAQYSLFNGEIIKGFTLVLEAYDLSKEIGFKEGEILYHETLSVFLNGSDMSSYHHQKARMISTQLNQNAAVRTVQIPDGYPPKFDDKLVMNLQKSLEHFKEAENQEISATISVALAFYYWSERDYDQFKLTTNRIIDFYSELKEYYPVFLYYSFLSYFAGYINNKDEVKLIESKTESLVLLLDDMNVRGALNFQLANYYRNKDQNIEAIERYLQCVDFLKSINDYYMLADVYVQMSQMYTNLELFDKSAEVLEKRLQIIVDHNFSIDMFTAYNVIMWAMYDAGNYDKAQYYLSRRENEMTDENREHFLADSYSLQGHILLDDKKYKEAIPLLEKALEISLRIDRTDSDEWEAYRLAYCLYQINDAQNALKYALISKETLSESNFRLQKRLSLLLSEIYEALGMKSLAYDQLKVYKNLTEESERVDVTNLVIKAEVRSVLDKNQMEIDLLEKEQLMKEQENKAQRLWIISIAGALLSALVVSLILYRNNKNRQKANELLTQQKERIQDTLAELNATQSQLIQSEKMASLGELTAGIAHEIQNPLNFVKNFSEVSTELIDEMIEDIDAGKEQEVKELASEIKENQERINHHGKRAGSIVKGMLQHSRISSGEKTSTDINALCDEYLRLSYHGLRAKDKSFNADLQTKLAENLPNIEVVPQDFGRVLLNLINNAFYAVKEKSEAIGKDFKPMVKVSTRLLKDQVEIKVSDNGNGIPTEVKDKIFQPFFTTKPAGQGTGLGLSLSYDIVRAHGGELKVETNEEKGTEFIIELPLKSRAI